MNGTRHTSGPDRVHNPSSPCACFVNFYGKAFSIHYCNTHGAAPDMLAALKACAAVLADHVQYDDDEGSAEQTALDGALAAIDKAEGRER